MARGRRSFGNTRRLPSGRWQARYTGPDLARHQAPLTFDTRGAAEGWLAVEHGKVVAGTWAPPTPWPSGPVPAVLTLAQYAEDWLTRRELRARTRAHYRRLLDRFVLPDLGARPLRSLRPADVAAWHSRLPTGTPTQRAHAYGLLRAVLATAVAEDLIPASPCRVRGGSSTRRRHQVRPATLDDLSTLAAAMPEHLRTMVLLAAWCALRYGELTELRRGDVDLDRGTIRVTRGVAWPGGGAGPVVGPPKTAAGRRVVNVPPHLVPVLTDHLNRHVEPGRDALLFSSPTDPSRHLRQSTFARPFNAARAAAGRPDLRFHDLRHTGAVLAASTGATLAELMARLGHASPGAAMRYQHAAADRDRVIAERLSALVGEG